MVFGRPPRQFLTSELMDTYRRRGMLEVDPQEGIDRSLGVFLDPAGRAVARGRRVGVRLSGPV
jgi:hypothetical protein